jgi:argininosuccinate synthase
MKKVVLAYSGGLDTTYCAKYLSDDLGYELYSAIVNTGGFSDEELVDVEKKAIELGVSKHVCLDETQNFYTKCVKYLIAGNVLKNNTYPLSVSAERIFQAIALAKYAKKIGADAIAHGSTGAGNDQVRFDMTFHIICPDIEIITPIRDMQLSREAEIEYLSAKGVVRDWSKSKYSINKGLWGTSVGGSETLTSNKYLPEEAWPTQVTKTGEEEIRLTFKNGEPVALNGESMSPVEVIVKLDALAGAYGVGRDIHVGDTIIGIKGRVGFEAAAPVVLVKAHHALEKHTLTKVQMNLKDPLANTYGSMVHDGQFMEPALRDIEAYINQSQKNVSGEVIVHLAPHRFHIVGIESEHDLMSDKFGSYGEMNKAWSGDDVKGFSKILGNQTMIYRLVNNE